MEPFETQGHWWIPNRPERCPGTLRCNETGELNLHLFGSFENSGDIASERFPIVYGEVHDLAGIKRTAPKGHFVTLLHSFVSNNFHDWAGTNTQSLFAHRAFFGDALLPADGERIGGANLRFSGLAGWASDLTGIMRGADPHFSRSWVRPEAIRIGFSKGEILLGAAISAPSTARRWALEESIGLNLIYHSPVTDSELSKEVWALQNFLTFATDRPSALTRLEVYQDSDKDQFTVVGPAVFDDAAVAEGVMAHELLFGHAEVGNRFEDVIRRWFGLSAKHSAAFAIYFGLKYSPPRYSDLRFQIMGQALSLYYTSRIGHPPVTTLPYNLTDEPSSLVRDELVRTHPIVVLANALRTLTEQYAVLFDPLIQARDDKSRLPFLEMATRTFQYVIGRESGAPEGPKGTTYYWLMELFGFLWKMALLDELGFAVDEQQKLFARNRMYQHIRSKVAPELFAIPRANP